MSWQIEDNPFAFCKYFAGHYIHLGVTGSIACYKTADLLRALLKIGLHSSATLTSGAKHFVTPLLFRSLGAEPVYDEMFEDDKDVYGHLMPGKNTSLLAVVPASANFLARLCAGAASDMLSAQALAHAGPLLLAPAMNPNMWKNAATCENIARLRSRGITIVPPGDGGTACGDTGTGRLADLAAIFLAMLKDLSPNDMRGLKILATLGPTREYWDDVRFWSNSSSGKMGCALATAAWLRGAEVTVIAGPCQKIYLPEEIRRINVNSGREMFEAASSLWSQCDMGLFCAAVSDFYPAPPQKIKGKIHRTEKNENFEIPFAVNPDILATLSARKKTSQKVLGFAAEIAPNLGALAPLAEKKLAAKKADVLVANMINPENSAFGTNENSVFILDRMGRSKSLHDESKADIAWDLLTWLLKI